LPFTGTFTVRAGDVNRYGFDDLIGALPGQARVVAQRANNRRPENQDSRLSIIH
jgi:hypothetical protein